MHVLCDGVRGLILIEDAAQAHGAEYREKRAGSLADLGCFSFYPTKNMTTGEGGMVTTDDDALAERLRLLINHGQSKKYLHSAIGYNYRMTNMGAAIGLVQLDRLEGSTSAGSITPATSTATSRVRGSSLPTLHRASGTSTTSTW